MKKLNFKKVALSLLIAGGVAFGANAQTFQKGNFLINAGVGTIGSGAGTAFGAAAEYGFTDQISGGASFMTASPGAGVSNTRIGARASYHLDMGTEGLDAYAGPTVGYQTVKIPSVTVMGTTYGGGSAGAVFYGAQAGARYMFAKNIGIYAEVGYAGASGGGGLAANGGLALKF